MWPHMTLTWGQILTLTFYGQYVNILLTYFDASQQEKHDAAKIMSIAFLVQSYLQKKSQKRGLDLTWPFANFTYQISR